MKLLTKMFKVSSFNKIWHTLRMLKYISPFIILAVFILIALEKGQKNYDGGNIFSFWWFYLSIVILWLVWMTIGVKYWWLGHIIMLVMTGLCMYAGFDYLSVRYLCIFCATYVIFLVVFEIFFTLSVLEASKKKGKK
ncbi:MAG: hypothetical protein ACRAS9_00650 [Mycoplasma sp.]